MSTQADLTVQLQRLADAEEETVSTSDIETAIITRDQPTSPQSQDLVPGQWLGHYRVDARIGQGGGGTVYKAHDSALERSVAIKRIHQQLCTEDWDHLKREATALMRLQHPNIATFFDLEERDNVAWLAMEFVDGVPLSEHLYQHGRLNLTELLKLAEGVLCALGHAHSAGVVHADIKPENIMLTADGRIKVLDFGIARLVHDMDLPDDQQFTRHDTISGSPGFMSPEQLRAAKLDARSDLFAVAAVLFQAATGEPAFGGSSAADRIHSVFSHRPGDIVRRLPGALGELLDSALDPNPSKRPANAAEMLYALRQLAAGEDQDELSRSLLLLPAEASSDAADLAWLGRALNNALRPMLEQTGRFKLVPDAQATELATTGDNAIALGQKLAAQRVVHGKLDRHGDEVELTIHISDVPTARTLAERKVSTPLDQVFSLQGELANWAAEQLAVNNQADQQAPRWDAVALCAKAETAFARGGKDGLREAAEYYSQALASQSDSIDALSGLTGVYAMRYAFTSDPADIARARELAERALSLDPDAHAARQWLVYILMRQYRPDEAMRETDIIMQRSSDPHMACYFAACCLAAEARYEDALRYYQTSLRFNTSRSWTWFGAGNCHARLNRHESARWCLQRAIDAEASGSHFNTAGCGAFLAELLRNEGQLEQAWETAKQALNRVESSDFIYRDSFRTLALITLGHIALDRNQRQTAETAFHQAELGIRGRPRALGAGHLLTQALAGKAAASNDPALLKLAKATLGDEANWNFDWLWGCHQDDSQQAIDQASQYLRSNSQVE